MVKKRKETISQRIDRQFSNLSPDQRMFLKVQAQDKESQRQQQEFARQQFEASRFGRISSGMGSVASDIVSGFRKFGSVGGSTAPAPRLTQEQEFIGEIFGGGDGCIMGGRGESLPQMNNTLMARRNGDEGTASMFGFGMESERSGVF